MKVVPESILKQTAARYVNWSLEEQTVFLLLDKTRKTFCSV
jgi:hypothetical protein